MAKRPRLNGVVNRINLVGIELEGGWDVIPPGEDIVRDGSVKFEPTEIPSPQPAPRLSLADQQVIIRRFMDLGHSQTRARAYLQAEIEQRQGIVRMVPAYKGEIVSKAMAVEAIEGWVKNAYPQHVNATCGLHVHMSFHHRINYSRLMCPEFTAFMVKRVSQFASDEALPGDHPQWDRVLNPHHRHCAHQYLGEGQAAMHKKDYESRGKVYSRYTFVNYCEKQHHTVEVRGLAMYSTADQAIRAIMAVVTGTNEFLSKFKQRERPERVRITSKPQPDMQFGSYLS